jgi:hypothetical protein
MGSGNYSTLFNFGGTFVNLTQNLYDDSTLNQGNM